MKSHTEYLKNKAQSIFKLKDSDLVQSMIKTADNISSLEFDACPVCHSTRSMHPPSSPCVCRVGT